MQVFSVPELSKLWQVSPDTIHGWIKKGELRVFNVHGFGKRPCWRIPAASLDEFAKLRSNTPVPKPKRRRASGGETFFD